MTDQHVRVAHGKAVREFPFIAASSGKFTDVFLPLSSKGSANSKQSELNRYQVTCQNEGTSLPTQVFLQDKVDDINRLIGHNWTTEEIKARLNKRNELKKKFDPAERQRVAQLLEDARARGDDAQAEELQTELIELQKQRLAFKTSLGPSKLTDKLSHSTEQDKLAERNRETRRINVDAVRKAQLKEKAKVRGIEQALKRGEHVQDDPSRRLRTKAKFLHDKNQVAEDKKGGAPAQTTPGGTPANGTSTPKKDQGLLHLAKLREQQNAVGLPTVHKPIMDDDVIGALDLDIDVEI